MPWCHECDRFLNPNTVSEDGSCPVCGRVVEATATPSIGGGGAGAAVDEAEDDIRAPWHFWVMVVGVVLYLGWRLIEGIGWAISSWF